VAADPLTTDPSPSGEESAEGSRADGEAPTDTGGLTESVPAPGGGEVADAPEGADPIFKVMELYDVTVELPANHAVALLVETEAPGRRLDIPLGMADATALAYALREMGTPRPLTHELFTDVLGRLRTDVVAVRLVGRRAGTYLAELDLMSTAGREVVPCRPSDGFNLALRQPVTAPILADERLLEAPGDLEPA
jgi:bifunctional DNase/RNase